MQIESVDLTDINRRIILTGRMDVPGTAEIETRLTALAATSQKYLVIDMRGVEFLGSIGIRALLINAKAVQQRSGRMILLVSPNSPASQVLKSSGIDMVIPVYTNPTAADTAAFG